MQVEEQGVEIKNSQDRIKDLITKLIFRDDYWGYLFSKMDRKIDQNLDAPMGVSPNIDGSIVLLYNPNFIDLMKDDFLEKTIEHEGIHLLNNHVPRLFRIIDDEINVYKRSEKIDRWNKASDCATNTIINGIKKSYFLTNNYEFKLYFPDIFGLPEKKIAEFYFQRIPEDKQQTNNKNNQSNQSNSYNKNNSNENGQSQQEDQNQNNQQNNSNGQSGNIDSHDVWLTNVSNVSDISSLASRTEQYIEQIIEESYNNVRNKGSLPSYITQRIEQLFKPPQIPYYQLIKKLVVGSRLTKQKTAYTRINKKRVYSFFIEDKKLPIISPFPGKTKDFSFKLSMLIDSSGSMSKDDILEALSGLKNLIENDKDCLTTVIENDARIQKEYVVKKIKDIQFNIKGRGGTELLPGLIRCKELQTDITLVFTDGYCEDLNYIDKMLLPKKIIYIITNDGSTKNIDRTGFIVRLPK